MRQFFGAFCFGGAFMEYIVTADEMKQYDNNTIRYFGIPSLVLMERAALSATEFILNKFPFAEKILIAAGCGNNGGDGMAIARLLYQNQKKITVYFPGNPDKLSDAALNQYETCQKYKIPIIPMLSTCEYDIVIDSLFGVGLNRDLNGIWKDAVSELNRMKGIKIAIDIASGIDADTGKILGEAFRADATISFAFKKRGHVLYPGADFSGDVYCMNMGIDQESFLEKFPQSYTYDASDITKMPVRLKNGNKGDFGKLLLFAGSNQMAGASILAGKAAYRMGAGLIRILSPAENREIIQTSLPEAVLSVYQTDQINENMLQDALQWSNCILAGPGIGTGKEAEAILLFLVKNSTCPMIIDADAINLIAKNQKIRQLIKEKTKSGQKIIMTPHMGELARLSDKTISDLKEEIIQTAITLSRELGVVLVCKDARTIVADGINTDQIYINTNGNQGMATAGSGDVLAGIITGIAGQRVDAFEAAKLGVLIHATSGDIAFEKYGGYAMMASDLIEHLKDITTCKNK